MKVFKKEKRHLSKYTKAKPNIRRSVTKKKILEQRKIQAYGWMKNRERRIKLREDKIKRLGSNLIKAMEWGYMAKYLDRSTKHLSKGEKLEKQKEIAELWMEGQRRVKEAEL